MSSFKVCFCRSGKVTPESNSGKFMPENIE